MDKAVPANKQSQAKHWVFTWNDKDDKYTYEDVIDRLAPHCDYLVFQQEKGEGTEKQQGTKHFQGYCEFKKPLRFSAVQKLCPCKPHWEKRKGTRKEARAYAMKEETRVDGPWEAGDKPFSPDKGPSQNQILDEMALLVKAGKTDQEIFDQFPGQAMRFMNNIQKVRFIFKPVRTEELKVVLLYGTPGTGKTRFFWETFPDGWSVPVGKDLWFTGYAGEKNVLIDDFAGNIGLTQLLQILDRYPVQLNAKHGHVWWCPTNILVTSNCHPCNWYDYSKRQDSYTALKRRFKAVFVFSPTATDGNADETDVEDFFENQKVDGRYHNPPEKKEWKQRHEDF